MRAALLLLCTIVPLRVALSQSPTSPATPPVTRPAKTYKLKDWGISPTHYDSNKQLAEEMAQGGENQLIGFDPTMHIANVQQDMAILYRQERQGMKTSLRIFRVDLQAGKSISIALPFHVVSEKFGNDDANASVKRMRSGQLLAGTNNRLMLIDENDLEIEDSHDLQDAPYAVFLGFTITPSGDQFVVHWRSDKQEVYVWHSLPSFVELKRQAIPYERHGVLTVPGNDVVLRRESDGIRAYPADSAPFLACGNQLCTQGVTFLKGNSFLLFGSSGLGRLDVGRSPSEVDVFPLQKFADDTSVFIESISDDQATVAVGSSSDLKTRGAKYPSGQYEIGIFTLSTRGPAWSVKFKPRPGSFDFFLGDDHRSVWTWQDDTTLSLYEAPPTLHE